MENNKSFEDYLQELDSIVRNLENKNISLDEAVNNFTKGIDLSKKCYELLDKNEKIVISKMTENGLEDFKQE